MAILLKMRDYGSGLVEYGYKISQDEFPASKGKRMRIVDQEEIEKRNRARAAVNVRRWIMSQRLDYMVTLTYRENVCDKNRAVRDLKLFIDALRVRVPDLSWLAVPERQKRGAWHWHIAVRGWQNIPMLRSVWLSVCGDGGVNVRAPKGSPGTARWGRLRLAYYLSKYMYKDMGQCSPGEHRYHRSREPGDYMELKISLAKFSDVLVFVENILIPSGLRVRQRIETAYGGWGATWESPSRKSTWRQATV